MLNIIEGGFLSGTHEYVIERIRALTVAGERAFLIVPEQQTVTREAEMTDLLPASAPLTFEVTNFTRLADTVFRTVGGIDGEHLDRTRRALVMWGVLRRLGKKGEINVNGDISAGLVDRTLAAVADMDSAGIKSDELLFAKDALGEADRRLISKMSELGKIMAEYKRVTEERYVGGANDVAAMERMLKANPEVFSGAHFYVEGFTSFTESQYAVLAHLATVTDVSASLVIPKSMRDAFEYLETVDTEKRLLLLAKKCGFEARITRFDGCVGNQYINECIKEIWRTEPKIDPAVLPYSNEIKIIESNNPFDECDFIAEDISRRVSRGARFSDFAIIARHADGYDGIIDRALAKAHVPCFYSRKRDADSFKPIKLIHSAYAAILYGYRAEDVIAYAKCTPGDLTRDECDELELYIKTWQIKGHNLLSDEPFTMNPDGYSSRKAPDIEARLEALTAARKKLISPLARLHEATKCSKTVKDHATALVNYLVEIRLESAIRNEAKELFDLGEILASEEYEGLWQSICRALDILVSTVGGEECTADSFHAQLKIALSGASVGRIPSFSDSVVVGSADSIHLHNKNHLYVLGINRQEFPETVSDNAYFTDKDKHTLSKLGLNIDADREIRGAKELFVFLRALSYANESATLLYTKESAGGAETPRAEVIGKIISMIGEKTILFKRSSDVATEERIISPESGIDKLGKLPCEKNRSLSEALSEAGLDDIITVSEGRITNDRMKVVDATDRRDEPLPLTQSMIDDYNNCPFLHFLKYKLRLTPERRAEFDSRNIGTFVHAVIEGFFTKVKKNGLSFSELDDKAVEVLTDECTKEYVDTLENKDLSAREELLISRLREASLPVIRDLRDEFSQSSFVPRYFELKIENGRDDMPEPARFSDSTGGEVYVYGTIDRVDTCKIGDEVYVRVVDYKTGKKTFSPEDLLKGKNLQMFLYLQSITDTQNQKFLGELGVEEGHAPKPAGVVYVNTEIGNVKVGSSSEEDVRAALSDAQKRIGMILEDADVINATGKDYSPVRLTKKNQIHKSDIKKAYTEEGWEELSETVSRVIGDIAGRMRKGEICATPSGEDACKYCNFKALCRSAK